MRNTLLTLSQIASLVLTLALATACGGEAPSAAAPPSPPAATPTAEPAGAPAASATLVPPLPSSWSTTAMTKEQQASFMKQNVMPAMSAVFKERDAAHYASFSCKTCHGPSYVNPHDFLPHLTMTGGKLTCFTDKPDMAKFMVESVTGKMAAAMGLPPYDRTTHQGFGCNGCHTVDMR